LHFGFKFRDPKYVVKSDTSHTGDAWKGFKTPEAARNTGSSSITRTGSYDANMNKTGK